MNLKVVILIFNACYLIATVIWAINDKSFESVAAIFGGLVSFASFFIANDNSFVIKQRNKVVQKGNNSNSVIGDVSHSNIGCTTNSTKL